MGIEARAARGRLRVDVRDNGPGLTHAEQGAIFEKFQQASDTLTDKPQGTGLGLPICRQIIEHFGGRIWVTSAPGEGATFPFTVLLARADRAAPAKSKTAEDAAE